MLAPWIPGSTQVLGQSLHSTQEVLRQSPNSTQEVLRNHARQPPLPSEAPTTVVGLCLAQSAARLNFEMAISLDVFLEFFETIVCSAFIYKLYYM